MAKRKARKGAVKQSSPENIENDVNNKTEKPEMEGKSSTFKDIELERRIASTRAICDVEEQHLLIGLRLLRSNCSHKQLQTPVLQFFKENMPNLTVKTNTDDGQFEVGWNEEEAERNMHASFLQQMFIANPHCRSAMPSSGGFGFPSKDGNTDLQIPDFFMGEPSNTQMFGLPDAFQTPGASSQRYSFGMTPKTQRVPKPGEMLHSAHGSPLGVYKEDNMEAIHESGED
ncbi:hypothetical protein MKW94_023131 [Papaver nudicaule]|uniref:Uncharacterized protein n=1 Tax=Papaver nudicaule TaxID=74823 RepID=A0AA41V5M5_PAPNU|nr:hypothetical protein [Papaver nudicaule]